MGTISGLNQLDKKTGKWRFYTEKDGLCNSTVLGILEDDSNHLWLSTAEGLSQFHPGTGVFRNFYVDDGLQGNEFNSGAYCKGRDGRLYFGGLNGFSAFFPGDITKNSHIPPIVITDFKVLNNSNFNLEKSILTTKKVTLSYRDVFSLEFAVLNYIATIKNRYACKLEGFHENWIQLNHNRYITFSSLPHGEYTFRVKGSNNDGVWNETGASLKIIIKPPFWQTWW
ncbi:MAG: histidine kinase, partial [bacterium]|nr:histidine kinase [bacterium]